MNPYLRSLARFPMQAAFRFLKFFFSSRRRHTRCSRDWSSDVCSSDLVDGLNVVDAKRTTAGAATKWILGPHQTADIPGWQISGQTSRGFFFTETGRSYAKWIGDTRNVGV